MREIVVHVTSGKPPREHRFSTKDHWLDYDLAGIMVVKKHSEDERPSESVAWFPVQHMVQAYIEDTSDR
jgi:hypothetical protein